MNKKVFQRVDEDAAYPLNKILNKNFTNILENLF
jgi:hypothetical protein